MSPDDAAPPDGFSEFDIAGIDQAVAEWQPVERPSQRRAARQLAPLIERILAVRPDLPTGQVRKILEANHRFGPLPTASTFNRELGAICNEVRSRLAPAKSAARPSPTRMRTARRPRPMITSTAENIGESRVGKAGLAPTAPAVPAPTAAVVRSTRTFHPFDLFDGKFAGKVFVHTQAIRAFFSAVEKRGEDTLLARLARQVIDDATSQPCLDKLHPRDREILEAALSLR
ncbi:hypothetical protein DAH66_17430 [Sphingomonas koreensis]|uniref:Uncharacterized protein n=1 Tax=Sphingomonas koreensis TaxID=93064 RepID=A0A430FZQ4_9SPHN|nr:hypothetical protein [Sphingomonas koreensis]RSY79347.1 hypothetical protein DAH66_17430 [Sphingomonas koreensis]